MLVNRLVTVVTTSPLPTGIHLIHQRRNMANKVLKLLMVCVLCVGFVYLAVWMYETLTN